MKRSPLRRSTPLQRKVGVRKSTKPLAKRGKAGEKRRARYKAFLSSPTWKRLRRQKIVAANGRCERCNAKLAHILAFGVAYQPPIIMMPENPRDIQVHHKHYRKALGAETMDDLELLCRPCHEKHHATTDRPFKGRFV